MCHLSVFFFFFKQKTAYELRISDWSSDVCSSDLSTAYTRDGSFSVSSEGRLVTNDGYPLQPDINIPEGAQSLTIGKDGTVTVMVPGDTQPSQIGQIELVNFLNPAGLQPLRSEEHTSELQSLMRISYAVFCLKKKITNQSHTKHNW